MTEYLSGLLLAICRLKTKCYLWNMFAYYKCPTGNMFHYMIYFLQQLIWFYFIFLGFVSGNRAGVVYVIFFISITCTLCYLLQCFSVKL